MSNKTIKPPFRTNHSLSSKLVWLNNSIIRLRFKKSCLKQDKVTFTPKNIVNLFFLYELDIWSQDLNADITLKDCLFGAVNLTKNSDPDKHSYLGYGIGFDSRSPLFYPNFYWGKNVAIFGVNNSSSMHIDKRRKNILVLVEGPTQGLDDASITAETKYSINFLKSQRKFCLSLYYIGSNSLLFVNATRIYQFKAKDAELKLYVLCLGNISKGFTANNIKKKIKWLRV